MLLGSRETSWHLFPGPGNLNPGEKESHFWNMAVRLGFCHFPVLSNVHHITSNHARPRAPEKFVEPKEGNSQRFTIWQLSGKLAGSGLLTGNLNVHNASPAWNGRVSREGRPCRKAWRCGKGGHWMPNSAVKKETMISWTDLGDFASQTFSATKKWWYCYEENMVSKSHNAMISPPFLIALTEAECVCIVDVKENIQECAK